MQNLFAVSGGRGPFMLRVYRYVFGSISLFCAYMCVQICLRVQGPLLEYPRAGRFRTSLLLYTICGPFLLYLEG